MIKSRNLIFCVASAFSALGAELATAADYPPGPPWHETCNELSEKGFGLAFTSAECKSEFLQVFSQSSIDDTHQWMQSRRGCFKEWAHFSWLAYERNDPAMAKLGWYHQLFILNERLQNQKSCTDLRCHEELATDLLKRGVVGRIGAETVSHTQQFLDRVSENQSFKKQMDKAYSSVNAICLYHSNLECTGAMRKLLDRMYPRSYTLQSVPPEHFTFSMIDSYRRVFVDETTQRFASRFALDVLRRISSGESSFVSEDNFFDLGLQYFENDHSRFWDFITVYATRGAAFATAYQMVAEENKPIFAAFMVLSSAMAIGDTELIAEGRAWSYGAGINSTCYQSKPYHFWMSASFSEYLVRSRYSKSTSILVSRLLGALYEAGSKTMGRDPDEIYFVPTFDPAVNRARREVSHHLLGSEFGASWRYTRTQDFDASFLNFMESSRALPTISESEMRERLKSDLDRWKMWTSLTGFYLK